MILRSGSRFGASPAGARRLAWLAGAPVRLALIGLVRLYRVILSGVLGGQCRFHPTCSAYAEEALRTRGAIRGVGLSVWRVLRCSPLSRGGVDPPPTARGEVARRPEAVWYDGVIPDVANEVEAKAPA